MKDQAINLEDYHYELPQGRIAAYPLKERDLAKLLVYRAGQINHDVFRNLGEYLPKHYSLFFNNTKVLPARIFFRKDTGAVIEVFLLHPEQPTRIVQEAMLVKEEAVWACTIGNLKRWKEGQVLSRELQVDGKEVLLKVALVDREKKWVKFSWQVSNEMEGNAIHFVDVVEAAGSTPLPPYLNREAEAQDKEEYQTVYSKKEGAVAAPTAGLHFTENQLALFQKEGRLLDELTLHVGAGTFQPVKVKDVREHDMHCEQIVVYKHNIENIIRSEKILSVGTTSMRTLESIYWYGVKLIKTAGNIPLFIEKLFPYEYEATALPDRKAAFEAVLEHMEANNIKELTGETEILLMPGYDFKVCDALITNFHMPSSTLILLIAAFVGEDWRKIYETALTENYRFLSYGDGSLLFRN